MSTLYFSINYFIFLILLLMTFFKSLSTAFFVMIAVILIICFMEVADELKHNEVMLYGIMVCVAITGCIGAAVGINLINSKG